RFRALTVRASLQREFRKFPGVIDVTKFLEGLRQKCRRLAVLIEIRRRREGRYRLLNVSGVEMTLAKQLERLEVRCQLDALRERGNRRIERTNLHQSPAFVKEIETAFRARSNRRLEFVGKIFDKAPITLDGDQQI